MTTETGLLPPPLAASRSDLADDVAVALDEPAVPKMGVVEAGGIPFATRTWGDPGGPPILLIHGVTASSRIWWRIGPALAAGLRTHVVAVDQLALLRHADDPEPVIAEGRWHGTIIDTPRGHGGFGYDAHFLDVATGMTAAALPGVGLAPAVLVLLDPPAIPVAAIATMLDDPIERHYDDLDEAVLALGRLHPTWPFGDVMAKAEALTQFDEPAVRAILTGNGDWDGGRAGLSDPAAGGVATWLIRGDPASGGLVPDDEALRIAEGIGLEHVITIAGGAHAPMRQRPEATVIALLHALA